MGLIDLVHQVIAVLPRQNGGTGNKQGYGTAVVEARLNRDGADIPFGTIVRREGSGRIETDDTEDSVEVMGVVIGYFTDAGEYVKGDCPDNGMCAVMTKGRTQVLVGGSGISGGEYIFVSSTPGAAKGDATAAAGAFGIADTTAGSGDLMYAWLYGAPVLSAGGGSVTWGTPALTFDTTNAAGSIDEAIRRDAQIAVFDGTAPVTQAMGDSAATGSAGKAARRDHKHGMPSFGAVTAETTFGLSSSNGVGTSVSRNDHTHGSPPLQKWEVSATFVSVTAGDQVWVRVPYACTITGWDITANASGSAVVDVWQDTYAHFPPVVGDSIAGTNKPTLSAARTNQNTTLSGWGDLTLDEGSYLVFNVDSVSGIATLNVVLYGTRSA